MTGVLWRGLIAGAAGTVALDVVSYLDMAARGRPASDLPGDVVAEGLEHVGIDLTGGGKNPPRREAFGALAGMGAGLGVGVAASVAHGLGLCRSPVIGSLVVGGLAMVAADAPATLLGATDPRTWPASGWVSDLVPHLAYGVVTEATLHSWD